MIYIYIGAIGSRCLQLQRCPLGASGNVSRRMADRDPTRGVMLEASRVLATGRRLQMHLKSWRPATANYMRWEIQRVLQPMGYNFEVRKNLKVCNVLRPLWARWQAIATLTNFEAHHTFGEPLHALVHRRGTSVEESSAAEQDYWASTPGLCIMLMDGCFRKRGGDRPSVNLVFKLLLQKTLEPEFCTELRTSPFRDDRLPLCDEREGGGPCVHLQTLVADDDALCPQDALGATMLQRFGTVHCPAAAAVLGDFLGAVKREIEERVCEWGKFDWVKSAEALLRAPSWQTSAYRLSRARVGRR